MAERVPDAIVVGGGIAGCSIARALSIRGLTAVVLERDVPGHGATWAAGGMLSPLGEASKHDALFHLAVASLDLWPHFASELAAESAIDVEYRPAGKLHVVMGSDDAGLRAIHARGSGFGVQLMSGTEVREIEPALSQAVGAALLVGRDHRVNNRLAGEAAWKAAVSRGVQVRTGVEVAGIEVEGGATPRFAAVRFADGTRLAGAAVIIAAGAWSGRVEGLPWRLPVEPVRGQMLAVTAGPRAPLLEHVVHAPGAYLIPREDGRVVIGATSERVGFQAGPTPSGLRVLIDAAILAVPALADLPVVETWAGFRPGTPDGLPLIGADPTVSGVYYGTGHYRNGVLLAPVTAEIVAALVLGERPAIAMEAFRVDRFEER